MERSVLHAYLSFLVLSYVLSVLVGCLISSFSIFFIWQRANIKGKTETKAEAKAEVEAKAVEEVVSQASDTMPSEKNKDTKKVCVFDYVCVFLVYFWAWM